MEKFITDEPQTNMEFIHNFCFKGTDGNVKFTTYENDVDLAEFAVSSANANGCSLSKEEVLHEGACLMCETDTCPNHVLYMAGVQAAELRERLKEYESTGLKPEEIQQLKAELKIE